MKRNRSYCCSEIERILFLNIIIITGFIVILISCSMPKDVQEDIQKDHQLVTIAIVSIFNSNSSFEKVPKIAMDYQPNEFEGISIFEGTN